MSLFRLAAVILFILALICLLAPTTIAGAGALVWIASGLLALALEGLFLVKVG